MATSKPEVTQDGYSLFNTLSNSNHKNAISIVALFSMHAWFGVALFPDFPRNPSLVGRAWLCLTVYFMHNYGAIVTSYFFLKSEGQVSANLSYLFLLQREHLCKRNNSKLQVTHLRVWGTVCDILLKLTYFITQITLAFFPRSHIVTLQFNSLCLHSPSYKN